MECKSNSGASPDIVRCLSTPPHLFSCQLIRQSVIPCEANQKAKENEERLKEENEKEEREREEPALPGSLSCHCSFPKPDVLKHA